MPRRVFTLAPALAGLGLALALALLPPLPLFGDELTDSRDRRTTTTWKARGADQPTAYGSEIATSPTDPTDLVTYVGPDCPSGQIRVRGAAGWTCIALPGGGGGGGSGATISSGEADPSGGSAGDAYIQVDAGDEVQSIWLNVLGTWAEYEVPQGGGLATVTTAAPVSGDGSGGTPVTIADGAIAPAKIQAGDSPADEECLTYEATGATFEYQPCASAGADGVVDGGSVSGATLTLTRTVGADVSITGLPSGGAADGVVEDATLALSGRDVSLSLGRSVGADVASNTITLPADQNTQRTDAEIDARIAAYARISPSGQIADAQIPPGIARDSEIAPGALQPADITAGSNISVTRGADSVTISATAGGMLSIDPVAFKTALNDVAVADDQTAYLHVLQFDDPGDISINRGGFTVQEGGAGDDTERLVIPENGTYVIAASLNTAGTIARTNVWFRFTIERSGAETAQPEISVQYNRGISPASDSGSSELEVLYELVAGDRIGLQARIESTAGSAWSVVGASSFLMAEKLGGPQGAEGPQGPPGADGADGADGTVITANPGSTAADLSSIGIAGTNYAVSGIVKPGLNGQLRAATAGDLNSVAIDHANLRIGTRFVDGTTQPAATFNDYGPASFDGIRSYCPRSGPNPATGNICFSTGNRLWYRWNGSGWDSRNANPPNWRGAYHSEAEAIAHIHRVGDILWWDGQSAVQFVTAYTPGATTYSYSWEPTADTKTLLRARNPAPSVAAAGQVPVVNATGDGYVLSSADFGSEVTANPSGASLALNAIGIDGTDYVIPDEVEEIPAARVELVGGDVNHYRFINAQATSVGRTYVFPSISTNTGPVTVRVLNNDSGVVKAGETGGAEAFEGGEWENGVWQAIRWTGAGFSWVGTTLGNAAKRDVGLDNAELVALNTANEFPAQVIPDASPTQVQSGVPSGRVLTMNVLGDLFDNVSLDAGNPLNESNDTGTSARRIAETFRLFGVEDVEIGGSGNNITVTTTRPNGAQSSSSFDISLTDELSELERLLQDLIDATGFHQGHDLVLADVVNLDNLWPEDTQGIDARTSKLHFQAGQINVFTYQTSGDVADGIYYNRTRIGDLPGSFQSSENYGGAVRVRLTTATDRYAWIDGDNINVQTAGDTTFQANSWRTLFNAPTPWISLAVESDDSSVGGQVWQLLYNPVSFQFRVGVAVISQSPVNNQLGSQSHADLSSADINGYLDTTLYEPRTNANTYNQTEGDGLSDLSVSRGKLWLFYNRLGLAPGRNNTSVTAAALGFDISYPGGNITIARNDVLDFEHPVGTARSTHVSKNANLDFVEDLYASTGSNNGWHYRDPDHIEVLWTNINGRPAPATQTEMEQITESEIRLMSPLNIGQALRANLEANPADASTVTLDKLKVEDVIYTVSTQLGTNEVSALLEILKHHPRNIVMMAQRMGPGDTRAGWDREERYDVGAPAGIGSVAEDMPDEVMAFYLNATDDAGINTSNRIVIETNEAADGRAYVGKQVIWNTHQYELEWLEHFALEGRNVYISTEEQGSNDLPADNAAGRLTWHVNIEDIDFPRRDYLSGWPWFFSLEPGHIDPGEATDDVVDGGSISGTTLTLTRSIGDDITIPGLPTGGGGGGTDDQTAAEVPVASAGFSGVLLAGDDNVQEVAQRLDDLTLGRGVLWNALPTGTPDSGDAFAFRDLDGIPRTEIVEFDALRNVADDRVTGGSVTGTTLTLDRHLGADIAITGLPSGGDDPFDGITTVTATLATNDLLLFRDISETVNRAKTVGGMFNDFNELFPSNSIDTDDYIFFTNVSNAGSPTHKISATDFMTSFPRLITAPLFAAPTDADEFIIFDVSDSNAVKRLSVSNVRETVGRVHVESSGLRVADNARTIDFGTDILVTEPTQGEASVTLSQNVARIDDIPGQEEVDDFVDNLLVAGANITLSYNDAANTMTITGQAGGGGTTVVANPGYLESNADLGSLTVGGVDYNVRHFHRGAYDNAAEYLRGDIIETGTGALTQFWIAREPISAGQGEPTEGEHGLWWHIAGFDGNWRGTLDATTQYDVYPGDYWIFGGELYVAVGAITSEPGSVLTRTGHDLVEQLVHSLRVMDESTDLTLDAQELNFTGAGITCTEGSDLVTCDVPGGGTAQNASTTQRGIIELATQAEVNSASPDSVRAVAPSTLQGFMTALRSDAAINFNTPSNESTLQVASRQAIAEALEDVDDATVTGGSVSGSTLTLTRTGEGDITIAGLPRGFDLHDDVAATAVPAAADRVLFSDEDQAGDPNRYSTFADVYDEVGTIVETNLGAAPADDDEVLLYDTSASGATMVTVANLAAAVGSGGGGGGSPAAPFAVMDSSFSTGGGTTAAVMTTTSGHAWSADNWYDLELSRNGGGENSTSYESISGRAIESLCDNRLQPTQPSNADFDNAISLKITRPHDTDAYTNAGHENLNIWCRSTTSLWVHYSEPGSLSMQLRIWAIPR